MNCESCGMPTGGKYCQYCVDSEGNLKDKNVVREGMIGLFMKKGKTRQEAEEYVDNYMKTMPAWQ